MRLSLVGPEPASASGWVCPLGPGDSLSRQTLPSWLTLRPRRFFYSPQTKAALTTRLWRSTHCC